MQYCSVSMHLSFSVWAIAACVMTVKVCVWRKFPCSICAFWGLTRRTTGRTYKPNQTNEDKYKCNTELIEVALLEVWFQFPISVIVYIWYICLYIVYALALTLFLLISFPFPRILFIGVFNLSFRISHLPLIPFQFSYGFDLNFGYFESERIFTHSLTPHSVRARIHSQLDYLWNAIKTNEWKPYGNI